MPNNFFNIFENILCLSLKESMERRQHIESEFAAVGIKKYKIIDAINQNDPKVFEMYKNGLVKKFPPCFRCGKNECNCDNNVLIPQQVANFLSHRKIWGYILEKDFKWALIVEDDIKFTDYYKNVLNDLKSKDYFSVYNIAKNSESLIRLGWAKSTDHNPKMKTALISNMLRMSNPCYFITNGQWVGQFYCPLLDHYK
jgi:GR25 family glycosyltransferase involved in LPS biosynthesis